MTDHTPPPDKASCAPPREVTYSAEPQPVITIGGVVAGLATVAVVAATGAMVLPAFGVFGASWGTARSARIEWEQRQIEIEEALAQQDVTVNGTASPSGRDL